MSPPPSRQTFDEAADALIKGMRDGSIRNRNRRSYKPPGSAGTKRSHHPIAAEIWPLPARPDSVQRHSGLRGGAVRGGLDPSRVRNTLMPIRVIYTRAVRRGEVLVNPTADLELPAAEGQRTRVATPAEAVARLNALPEQDRALWATALTPGCATASFARSALRMSISTPGTSGSSGHGMKGKESSRRRAAPARCPLGPVASGPYDYGRVTRQAYAAWRAARIERITLHECRHSFSSYLDHAGVSETRADRYMGHAITPCPIGIAISSMGRLTVTPRSWTSTFAVLPQAEFVAIAKAVSAA